MDIGAIQGVLTSLKTATDVSRALLEIKISAEVQTKVIELQSALLATQSDALAAISAQQRLQERVSELEALLRGIDDWAGQKRRYTLVTPWKGPAQVYGLIAAAAEGEAAHYLCTNCFHDRKRVILNPLTRSNYVHMVCPTCKAELNTGYRGIPEASYA